MSSSLWRPETPEEAELARRQLALSALRVLLVAREHALAELRAQLLSFEGRYIRQVGKLYKQLDEWEQKIAELDSPLMTDQTAASEAEIDGAEERDGDAEEENGSEAAGNLKALFRELARRVHPDFASNPADAQLRTLLMAQANDAFQRKDASMLHRMLHGHTDPDARSNTADKLARTLEESAQVEEDIGRIDTEMESLAHSELAKLQRRVIETARTGRDLLAEMAARVKGNIGMAMRRYELDLERKKRKQPAFDPTSLLSAEEAQEERPRSARHPTPRHDR